MVCSGGKEFLDDTVDSSLVTAVHAVDTRGYGASEIMGNENPASCTEHTSATARANARHFREELQTEMTGGSSRAQYEKFLPERRGRKLKRHVDRHRA